uniref:tetratricopeptide repeat protein n=1 Tax=Desertibaculum subflavum TaxID=2268458 RepID=UPI0013C49B4C
MSRRSLAPLLLAGTTLVALTGCTSGQQAGPPPVVVAQPRPVDPAVLLAEGDRLAATGDLYAAIDSYMAARRAAPTHADAAARLGLTLAEQGRHAEALPHLKDAERARRDDLAIVRVLVNALLALERPGEANAHLAPALAQHPEDARLWNASGIAADMMGDSTGAATAYRTGLAAAPDNLSLKVNLALSRFASGDAEGASMAATAAGLSMAEVESRANRLIAYRSRTLGPATMAAGAKLGTVPEAPPMVALALPPVRVQELPPVTPAPAPPPAVAASAPEAAPEPKIGDAAAQSSTDVMPPAETAPVHAPSPQIAAAPVAEAGSAAVAADPVAAPAAPTAAPAAAPESQTVVAGADAPPPAAAPVNDRP